jgi:hypothetical protein
VAKIQPSGRNIVDNKKKIAALNKKEGLFSFCHFVKYRNPPKIDEKYMVLAVMEIPNHTCHGKNPMSKIEKYPVLLLKSIFAKWKRINISNK